LKKDILRGAAKLALIRRFGNVRVGKAQGVIPGARLEYSDGGRKREAAVRTANEREVGLLRDRHGNWRTLSKVQLVLVAVPSDADDEIVDVLAFDPEQLKIEFDKVVKLTEKGRRSVNRFKAPVFLPLTPSGTKNRGALHSIIQWTEKISRSEIPEPVETSADSEAAMEVIRAGIAKGLGIDASRVEVTYSFRLIP
jgi:hypothetical protein